MQKVLTIAWNSLLRTSRDKRSLIMLLVMPLVLVAILGSALKGMMHDGTIEPFDVILVNQDAAVSQPGLPGQPAPQVNLGQSLAKDVFGSDEAKKVIRLTETTDLDQAKADVTVGKAVAAVYVPADFTAGVLAGRPAQVQVFTDPGQPTLADIVTQVVRTFTDAAAAGPLAAHVLTPAQLGALLQSSQGQGAFSQKAMPSLREIASGARPVSAMQYYAAGMLAMFMVMTAFTRARDILQERQQGTLARLLVSPTGTGTIVAGQMLGSLVVLLAQLAVMVLGTRLIYQVDWGGWQAILLIGLAFGLANTGISALTAGLLRDPKAADAMVGVAGNVFGILSGSTFPLYAFPAGLRLAARFVPNYWALTGFLDQMAGVGLQAAVLPVVVLTAIGLVSGALGAWRMAAKGV